MTRALSYFLLALLFAAACVKETTGIEEETKGPVIELDLISDDLYLSKAGSDGTMDGLDGDYNENLISWVDFFFYPGGDTENPATYHVRLPSGNRRGAYFRIDFSDNEVDVINTLIFPSAEDIRTATVVAVANWPTELVEVNAQTGEEDLSNTALPILEAKQTQTDFANQSHFQPRFIMTGSATIALRGRGQVLAATGSINLNRLACKLTVGINVASEVTVGDDIWKPMLSNMEIYLVNGVDNVRLGGEELIEPHHFSYSDNRLRFARTDANGDLHFYFEKIGDYYTTYPTYMYPQHWTHNMQDGDEREPYLKLVLPWHKEGETQQKQYYYKILIPKDNRPEYAYSFVRNNWYHINVRVGILGSETDEATVPVNGWCYIYDWQDKNVVVKNAQIGAARYLAVDRNKYQLYNISDPVSLGYVSSHPIDIIDVEATRPYYGTANVGTKLPIFGGAIVQLDADGSRTGLQGGKYLKYPNETVLSWLTDKGNAIVFHHELNNKYNTADFDYSPYTISYTLVHKGREDDQTYRKTQVIVQRPAIYIESTPNPDIVNGTNTKHWGYVWVDGDQYTRARYEVDIKTHEGYASENDFASDHIWRVVHYSGGGTDMYKINVTVLPEDSDLVIGDPRQDTKDNLRNQNAALSDFRDARYIIVNDKGEEEVSPEGAGLRTLQYYYPTEASERTKNMVAPSFRISTKFSGTEYNGTGLEQARYRCASFQENGFPAGRWRLPTMGEVRFASQLSAMGIFEWQFRGNYWSANGAINVSDNSDVKEMPDLKTALIRCVYDSWYWGWMDSDENLHEFQVPKKESNGNESDGPEDFFVWGDRER